MPTPPTGSKSHILDSADIEWLEDGQPFSKKFDDVYFSKHNGLEESRYVFLQGNKLEERWNLLKKIEEVNSNFVIAELGFGTSLNFLATWQLWNQLELNSSGHKLHFISVERHPLTKSDLEQSLQLWPELNSLTEKLVSAYPSALTKGFHRLNFVDDNVSLTLIFDDSVAALQQCQASAHPLFSYANFFGVDAWYLDGFTPTRNPGMWSEGLFSTIATLSKVNSTAATYSAAGHVRRNLKKYGFEVHKITGFSSKREMVIARFLAQSSNDELPIPSSGCFTSPYPAPWFVINDNHKNNKVHSNTNTALIIGGGLSGCHTAHVLANKGWNITILEEQDEIAQKASGNPQGIVFAKLSADNDPLAEFNLSALQYALRFYSQLWGSKRKEEGPSIGEACGTLHLAHNEKEQRVLNQLKAAFPSSDYGSNSFIRFVTSEQASVLAGVEISYPGYFIENSGWLNPPELCQRLIDHPNIQVLTNTKIDNLIFDNNSQWQAQDKNQNIVAKATVAIISNAHDAAYLTQSSHLPLKSLRGQISAFNKSDVIRELKTVVCAEGYIAPAQRIGIENKNELLQQTFGSTFTLHNKSDEVTIDDHKDNKNKLARALANLKDSIETIETTSLSGRSGFRCTTPDYLPVAGPLPDTQQFMNDYQALSKNSNANIKKPGSYLPSLFINAGHGSRGLAYIPLCAELLASQIENTPLPVSQSLATALNPARFLIRDIIRGKLKNFN